MIPYLLAAIGGYLIGQSREVSQGMMAAAGMYVPKPRLNCVCKKTIKFKNGMNYFEKLTYGCTDSLTGDAVSVSYDDGRFTVMSKDIFDEHFKVIGK